MTNNHRILFISVLIVASLACGLISNPVNDVQNLASTAQSIATSMPIETLQALPSSMPDVGQYLNPTGTPVSQWKDIPIMTQATAGQEFNANTYSFKASGVTETDVQTFYNDKLKTLGWSSTFGALGSIMLFTKDSNVLSITVSAEDPDVVVLLIYQ